METLTNAGLVNWWPQFLRVPVYPNNVYVATKIDISQGV